MRYSILASVILCALSSADAGQPEGVDIGERRELFLDQHLVEKITGAAKLEIVQPKPKEVVLTTGEAWEGNTCAYYTIFQDGDRYRMYYRGSHYDTKTKKGTHPEVVCYAESKDGVNWKKPKLGLVEFNGSKANNIVWDGVGSHNFTVFKDQNPNCPLDQKYKAFGSGRRGEQRGLYPMQSADGIKWSLMSKTPVITKGAFDSQNLAFWDPVTRQYRGYHRGFKNRLRDIMTETSEDFLTWTEPKFLDYTGAPRQHLYTNTIQRYPRAPHMLIGFPTRYLPAEGQRVEPTLMSSRDGQSFHRWNDPVIPQSAPKDRAGNRSNYMTWGLLELPGDDEHYSVYATEAYYTGPDSRVRRFTFRKDGFVALRSGEKKGELLTKPIQFRGVKLQLNYAVKDGGTVRAELQDSAGKAIAGFSLADCKPLTGDSLAAGVAWKGSSLKAIAGKPVRLRIEVQNAEVFAYQFASK